MLFIDFLSLKVIAIGDYGYQALLYHVTVSFAGEILLE